MAGIKELAEWLNDKKKIIFTIAIFINVLHFILKSFGIDCHKQFLIMYDVFFVLWIFPMIIYGRG